MIDTIKIVSMIKLNTYQTIQKQSVIKTSYSTSTGEVFYKIINASLEGSYNSSIAVRVGEGCKYKFVNNYYIEIEGSYHKLVQGYNSHNGYYNIVNIAMELIKMVENAYHVKLPHIKHWFIQRVDVAITFDLVNQVNVINYINNLNFCNYPRRNLKHYEGESIYVTGSTTTIKIYNKLREFRKHDLSNFKGTEFNLIEYCETISGFVRFECEIKKRKLKSIFGKNYIRVCSISYKQLRDIWNEEFHKFFKMIDNDLCIVKERNSVKLRLQQMFKGVRAKNLYNFYLLILLQGLQEVKRNSNKSMYYKNIADLKKANVDFTQTIDINLDDNIVDFNPFESKEIL